MSRMSFRLFWRETDVCKEPVELWLITVRPVPSPLLFWLSRAAAIARTRSGSTTVWAFTVAWDPASAPEDGAADRAD